MMKMNIISIEFKNDNCSISGLHRVLNDLKYCMNNKLILMQDRSLGPHIMIKILHMFVCKLCNYQLPWI